MVAVILQNEATSALPKIITTGFKAIRLIYFFTAGEDEVKCWQIRKGAKAPQVIPCRVLLVFTVAIVRTQISTLSGSQRANAYQT